ncbi:hypothetical protein FKM82_022632 [Ascaphus truei]
MGFYGLKYIKGLYTFLTGTMPLPIPSFALYWEVCNAAICVTRRNGQGGINSRGDDRKMYDFVPFKSL